MEILDRNTRLSGRWLILARVAWAVITLLILSVFITALPARFNELSQDPYQFQPILKQLGLGIEFFAFYTIVLDTLLALACLTIAVVIFWQKSDERLGLIVSLSLVFFIPILPVILALGNVYPAWQTALYSLRFFSFLLILLVLNLFPDGHFVPTWTRNLMVLWFILALILVVVPGFNQPAVPIDLKTWQQGIALIIVLFATSTGIYAQLYRYRHVSNAVQRQQTKWVVFGFSAVFTGIAVVSLPVILFPVFRTPGINSFIYVMIDIPITLLSLFMLPFSLALSILKYHLWDIDIIIRRTLVYGALTITLAVVYFAGVVLLQELFQVMTGQHQSSIAIVISTLAIAALFTRFRQRIQNDIDRRFYRRKYDSEKMLKAFANTVRDEVELEKLVDRLLSVVEDTLRPEHVNLWIRPTPGKVKNSNQV